MCTNKTFPEIVIYLTELKDKGFLNEEQIASLKHSFGWNPKINSLVFPVAGSLSEAEYWRALILFLEVMDFRDTVYPQPEKQALDDMRMSALPLLATDRSWKNRYLALGGTAEVLVSMLLRALWNRQRVVNDTYAVSATSIYSQWTRRRANPADSIGSLEEKISKTMFGEAWWLLCEPDNEGGGLYNLVQNDKPTVLAKWKVKDRAAQNTHLPSGTDFF